MKKDRVTQKDSVLGEPKQAGIRANAWQARVQNFDFHICKYYRHMVHETLIGLNDVQKLISQVISIFTRNS
jgi:hypothetical protein